MGHEGMLYDLDRDLYFVINHTARLIWEFVEAHPGTTADNIIDHLFRDSCTARDTIARDVSDLLTLWHERWILDLYADNEPHE